MRQLLFSDAFGLNNGASVYVEIIYKISLSL